MRVLMITAMATALAVGCGDPAAPRPHTHVPVSAPAALTKFEACGQLLDSVTRHRGVPDMPTLRRIADHVTDPRMAADARTAVRDLDHTGMAPVAFTLLRDDCARAGVRIPPPD